MVCWIYCLNILSCSVWLYVSLSKFYMLHITKLFSSSRIKVRLNIIKADMESLHLLVCIILLWLTNTAVYILCTKTRNLPLSLNQNKFHMQLIHSWSIPSYSTNKISNLWPTFDFMLKALSTLFKSSHKLLRSNFLTSLLI